MAVEVDRGSLAQIWRERDFYDIPFGFYPSDPEVDVLEPFTRALFDLNDSTEGEHDPPFGEAPTDIPGGVGAIISSPGFETQLWPWVEDLATRLSRAGLDGVIRAFRSDDGPAWAMPTALGLGWGLAATLSFAPRGDHRGIDVEPDLAAEVGRVAWDWANRPGAQIYLERELFTSPADPAEFPALLVASAERLGSAQAVVIDESVRQVRCVGLVSRGWVFASVSVGDASWHEPVRLLTALATDLGPIAEQVLIRRMMPRSAIWSEVDRAPRPLAPTGRFNSDLELRRRYVSDAYGVQVLTDAHLERARHLSGWTITPLDNGRHLVVHPDQAGWYAEHEPRPDLLAQARADFGPLILAPDARS